MRELKMEDFHRFSQMIDVIIEKYNVYDSASLAEKQWLMIIKELPSLSRHFLLFSTYEDPLLRKKEVEILYSISETLFWRFTYLKRWTMLMSTRLSDESEQTFNAWILSRADKIIELQNSLTTTSFQGWCRGNENGNIFTLTEMLYNNSMNSFNTFSDTITNDIYTLSEWDCRINSYICGTHKFDGLLTHHQKELGEIMEKYLLAVNHVLFEFQSICVPFMENPFNNDVPTFPPQQSLCHLDIFKNSLYYQQEKEKIINITTRKELEFVLKEDEQRYGPLLKKYKTAKLNKSVPTLAVEIAKSGFANWINLLTVAALYEDSENKPHIISDEKLCKAIESALAVNGNSQTVKWVGVWFAWRELGLPDAKDYTQFIDLMNSERFKKSHGKPCTETSLKVYHADSYLSRTAISDWNDEKWHPMHAKSNKKHFSVIRDSANAFMKALR